MLLIVLRKKFELENNILSLSVTNIIALESKLTTNLKVRWGQEILDVKLTGRIDRLDVLNDREIRIIDYKTGKSPKPGWEDKALFQLRVYALLYWKEKKIIPKLLQFMTLVRSAKRQMKKANASSKLKK